MSNRMELNRLSLHRLLHNVIGNENLYFQPPESIKLKYPCIVYSRNTIDNKYADNYVYKQSYRYTITVIDKDPDSYIAHKVSKIPCIRHDRTYVSENLNHDVFSLVYQTEE